jgi:GT2 family glycosyltransferase
MEVSVIIVTFSSAAHIRESLESVRRQKGVLAETIVVDNASSDQTVEVVQNFGEGTQILANQENIGFGRGCNQGFAVSRGRFIYLLNPDAQLTNEKDLSNLCREMAAHSAWGLAGTRILTADGQATSPPGTSYPGQFRTRNEFASLPGQVAWVLGASMFFRRETFAELGGFDPEFFLYSEETDLCLRLRQRGHEIGFVESVAVRHIGGASEGSRDPYGEWTRRMNGMHLFWRKHYSPEDAASLVRRDLYRALYRMLANGLLAKFRSDQSTAWQKSRRYRAIWETSRKYLVEQRRFRRR